MEYLKTDINFFPGKFVFVQIWAKQVQIGPKIVFFSIFWKILSLVFLGNNLKLKQLLLFIFEPQSYIWENSAAWVMGQNAVSQSNCRVLENLRKEVNHEVYFWHADKHRSLLQVDPISLGVHNQACPKYSK